MGKDASSLNEAGESSLGVTKTLAVSKPMLKKTMFPSSILIICDEPPFSVCRIPDQMSGISKRKARDFADEIALAYLDSTMNAGLSLKATRITTPFKGQHHQGELAFGHSPAISLQHDRDAAPTTAANSNR